MATKPLTMPKPTKPAIETALDEPLPTPEVQEIALEETNFDQIALEALRRGDMPGYHAAMQASLDATLKAARG